jgi:hypothetical protein
MSRTRRASTHRSGARFISDLEKLNRLEFEVTNNPEIATRIAKYEMAFRMQTSVPELTDLSKEPEHTFELYGPDSRKPGTYAANCLLARRLAERGVRFIQLYHRAWDLSGCLMATADPPISPFAYPTYPACDRDRPAAPSDPGCARRPGCFPGRCTRAVLPPAPDAP